VDQQHDNRNFGRFDLNEIATSFPPTAETLLIDTYLSNEDAASSRVFRVYRCRSAQRSNRVPRDRHAHAPSW
jgi:hypothetical protein